MFRGDVFFPFELRHLMGEKKEFSQRDSSRDDAYWEHTYLHKMEKRAFK